MNAKEKMVKARAGLVLDMPFFGSLALRLVFQEDPGCETAWVDGITLGYDPEFINQLSLAEVKALICHEVLHCANEHHVRRGQRDFQKWNVACDYAINPLIEKSGLTLPKGRLLDPSFYDLTAEEIYAQLPNDNNTSNEGNVNSRSMGQVRDLPSQKESAIAKSKEDWKIAVSQAASVAKSCGNIPAGLKRMIEEIVNPRLDYRVLLDRFLQRIVRNDYRWFPPNKRLLHHGYFPGMRSETIGKLVIVIDTSGSVTRRMLEEFQADIQGIMENLNTEMEILYCDYKLYEKQNFFPGDLVRLNPIGGGGTSYVPPFEYLSKTTDTEIAGIVYFTDGECNDFYKKSVSYPVLWVISGGNKNFEPPYGEVIVV